MDPSESTATVQPEGGEGGAGPEANGSNELFDLNSVPEELRQYVDPIVKQIQGNVTQRFQEHADFRKQWEPFTEVDGLQDVPAERLQELLQFNQIASDPEQFDGWMVQYLQALGEAEPDRLEGLFDKFDEAGLFGDEEGDPSGDPESDGGDMRSVLRELLEEELGPIKERLSSQDEEAGIEQAQQQIRAEIDQVKARHKESFGEELSDDQLKDMTKLAHAYDGADDAIEKAYQDYLRITGQAQGDLVDEKLGQPQPAIAGGSADASPERTSFVGNGTPPKTAALARLRAG
jgi:hypothetical protein